jgi:hypothetical protein
VVLRQIASRAPKDLARLRGRVRRFAPLPRSERRRRIPGRFFQHSHDFESPGVVQIDASNPALVALVAHELGHACTREEQFDRRTPDNDEEWASEMCADYYAYKWGFGRAIAARRRRRELAHHGPTPRQEFTLESGEDVARYRVTRRFYIHFVQSETKDGQVIETATQRTERFRREFEELTKRKATT